MKNLIEYMKRKATSLKNSVKGEMSSFAINGIITFIVIGVILYIMFPILGGVSAATPVQTGALSYAQGNVTNAIASGATLAGIVEIVVAAVVILGVLIYGLVRKT